MLEHKGIEALAAVIFTVVAIVHVLRLVYGWEVYIGSWEMPIWMSVAGIIVSGLLAIAFWRSVAKGGM